MTQHPAPRRPPPLPPTYAAPPYGQPPPHLPYAQHYLSGRPGVVTWFYVYCVCLALLYAGLVALFGWLASEGDLSDPDDLPFVLVAVICVPLMLAFAAAPLLPRRPWVWIYDLVLICIGMSGFTVVACVPLLIFWLKPEAKVWFGRQP